MASKKPTRKTKKSPTLKAYEAQWKRITGIARKLEKQGFTVDLSFIGEKKTKPVPRSVQALKEIRPVHIRSHATVRVGSGEGAIEFTAKDIWYERKNQEKIKRRKKRERLKNANTETVVGEEGGYRVKPIGEKLPSKQRKKVSTTASYDYAPTVEDGDASVLWLGYSEPEPEEPGEYQPKGQEKPFWLVGDLGMTLTDLGSITRGSDERGQYFQSEKTGEKWYIGEREKETVDYYRVGKTRTGEEKIIWLSSSKRTIEDLGETEHGTDENGEYYQDKETGFKWYKKSKKEMVTDLYAYREIPSIRGNALTAISKMLKPANYYDRSKAPNSFTQFATENLVRLHALIDVLKARVEEGDTSIYENIQKNLETIEDLIYALTRDYKEIRDHSTKNFSLLYEAITGEKMDAGTALAVDSAEESYYSLSYDTDAEF